MTIPLDDEPADPGSGEKKGRKRTRGYQNPDELQNYREIMKDIKSKIGSAYGAAYDAIREQESS